MRHNLGINRGGFHIPSSGRELRGAHTFEAYRKYLIQFHRTITRFVRNIEESLKAGEDDKAISELRVARSYLEKHKRETRTSSPNTLAGQLSCLVELKRLDALESTSLLSRINSFDDTQESLNRKKALILCQVFTQRDLQAEWESSDIEEALKVLSVRGDKDKTNVKASALHLAGIADSERLAYCITPGYKRLLEGYRLDPNQEMQKYNGREVSYWRDEIKRKIDLAYQRALRLHQRAVVDTRNKIADKKPKAISHNSSAATATQIKKSPGTPRELSQVEIDELILRAYEEQARHSVGSFDDFISVVSDKTGHGINKQLVCERLAEIGLTENDFHIVRAYRELGGHINGKITQELLERQLEGHLGYVLDESVSLQNRLIFLKFQFPNLMGVGNSSELASVNSPTNDIEEFFTRPISRWESNIGSLLRAIGYEDRTFNTIHDVHVKFHDLDDRKRRGPLRAQYEEFDKDRISVTIYYSDGKEPEYVVIPDLNKSEYQILSRRLSESAV